jgi:hypothetical protein
MFEPVQGSFDEVLAPARPEPVTAAPLITAITAARRENQAAAARLTAIGDLYALRFAHRDTISDQWAVDTQTAVAAEVAAALHISSGAAAIQVSLARGLRERLPNLAAVFRTGELTLTVVDTVLHRTDLITDPNVLARVDAQLAAAAARLVTLSDGALAGYIDRVITRLDPDAVRRRNKAADKRHVQIIDYLDGISDVHATVHTPSAHALDHRLDALAATVCPADPRTKDQRRADAIDALTAGADRLQCLCGREDCPNRDAIASPFVIHIVTATADNTGPADSAEGEPDSAGGEPDTTEQVATLVRNDGLLPPELLDRLAADAKTRPLTHPGDAPPEPRYTPSRALAEFVRCRDLTCRFPGCEVPAFTTDIDHTIAYADGGPTQAANLKCLCRLHHLLKTFWGWTDQQLPDGTIIWTSPAGHTYVTTPGSALLFPHLCTPTAPVEHHKKPPDRCGERTAMMPRRTRTRAQSRATRIAAERDANHHTRITRRNRIHPYFAPTPPPQPGDDPPPF